MSLRSDPLVSWSITNCYDTWIASLSLHLSPCINFFGLVLEMSFHNQDRYLMQNICFGFVLREW